MNSKLDLYKQFYLKELATRTELNNAINLPITILTAVIGAHVYMISKTPNEKLLPFIAGAEILTIIPFFTAGWYLTKSYSKFWRRHWYAEIEGMEKYYSFQLECIEKNQIEQFDKHLEQQFATTAGINFKLNVNRAADIAKAKVSIFISMVLTLIASLIFISSFLIKQ